jgi:phosphoribosyl-AMP cyclohydrolase
MRPVRNALRFFSPMIPALANLGLFVSITPGSTFKIHPMNFDFKYNADGLIPAIVQETGSNRVLMMAWMNRAAIERTLETGLMNYWSRSRQKSWLKGETSGHTQRVVRWYADCDRDTLLFEVEQTGGACHTGYHSCFFQPLNRDGSPGEIEEQKVFDPAKTYN